jgi:transcriptional regulator with XRE-family HTH domain
VKNFKKYSDVFELFEEIGFHYSEEEKVFVEAMSQIGGQLMAYRKKYNLTQKELAEKLGISQSMVSKIETGEKNVSVKVLAKIVAALGGKLKISLGILPEEENKPPKYKFGISEEMSMPFETKRSVAA